MRKIIEVDQAIHLKLKAQASRRGKSMKEYINWLCDRDKSKLMREGK